MLLAAALIAINPIGFIGGHWDDGRYLEAALGWVQGARLGQNHWSLRWPVILPAALMVKLYGLTRTSLMLPGLAAFSLLTIVHFFATRRAFGSRVAALALLALVTTPELLRAATRLTAELPELLGWLVALWAFWFAARSASGQRALLLLAGVATGLAWATRETALGLILLFGIAALTGWQRERLPLRHYLWVAAGFALLALPELAAYARASGDTFYRLHVDMAHVTIASTNLDGLTFAGQRIMLNPDLMERWHGAGPLRLHWALDPWTNLFANDAYGFGFLAAGFALLAVSGSNLPPRLRSLLRPLLAVIVVQVSTVVYIIATDPKPRMFMPSLLAASLLFGLAAQALCATRAGRILVVMLVGAKLIVTIIALDLSTSGADVAIQVQAVLAQADGPVHVSNWTASQLALAPAPERAQLTTAPPGNGDLVLTIDGQGGIDDGSNTMNDVLVGRSPPGRMPLIVTALVRLGIPVDGSLAPLARGHRTTVNLNRRAVN